MLFQSPLLFQAKISSQTQTVSTCRSVPFPHPMLELDGFISFCLCNPKSFRTSFSTLGLRSWKLCASHCLWRTPCCVLQLVCSPFGSWLDICHATSSQQWAVSRPILFAPKGRIGCMEFASGRCRCRKVYDKGCQITLLPYHGPVYDRVTPSRPT